MASPALAVVLPRKLTMWNLEEQLQMLVDTSELDAAKQDVEFLAEMEAALKAAKDKRDAVAAFIVQCEGQAKTAEREIERMQKRKARFEAAAERIAGYVLHVIMRQPKNAEGKYPKLEGNSFAFSARQNPPSVSITDAEKVPTACKRVDVSMPAQLWEQVLDALPAETAAAVLDLARSSESAVKAIVKEEIALAIPDWKQRLEMQPSVGTDKVPGAAINAGTWRLVRE